MVRIERLEAAATLIAGIMLAVAIHLPVRLIALVIDMGDVHDALAQLECRLNRVRQPATLRRPDNQAIDNDFNEVLAAMIDVGRLVDAVRLAIDAHADKAGAANLFPQSFVFLLPLALDRGQEIELGPLGQAVDLLDDLVGRLRADGQLAGGTIGLAEPGVEDEEELVE